MAAGIFTYGFGLTTLARHDQHARPAHQRIRSRCETLTELHRRWGWIVLLGPRQLDLEEEMRQAWDGYVEKRNAYLVAAGFPKPA